MDETWQDRDVFNFGSFDLGGRSVSLFARQCQWKHHSWHCGTSLGKEPSVFLCLRASRGFYLHQDAVSAMSGESVCWALGEHEQEELLFTVWLQHTNVREASLVRGSACSARGQEGQSHRLRMRAKGHCPRDQAEQTQALPQRLGSGVSPRCPLTKLSDCPAASNEVLHQQLVDNDQECWARPSLISVLRCIVSQPLDPCTLCTIEVDMHTAEKGERQKARVLVCCFQVPSHSEVPSSTVSHWNINRVWQLL